MDLQKIKALIDLLADSPLAKLEVIEGEERVKLVKAKRRGKRADARAGGERAAATSTPGLQGSQGAQEVRGAQAPLAEPAQSVDTPQAAPATASEPQLVRAPMFGVVHLTPAPGEAPFVNPGDTIEEGQVLCTIEAMKMFNAIESELSGAVLEILVAPGSEVESGQPLFRIG
ncbi:acetyl-CoA carboxylase biotin carboxyl carrier protein [Paraburkholderia caffeinilytica]|uniref:Biotin carboxyl carrier protein of acetyl-CoA carboxylase n=1 Tax=Paraburkholderia caffeinilytica TaxID=1761016 RepID=A0ABQ1NDM1_9BURK|nr:acetyl-CoA carboxylase biotin carboxyl carrier protein subunit [Paraburkholderia caffeinilytica]GGC62162.1 acetyl-CoA carboxylase biotin carboxyl carrier protein subunit [Paraburkholderia caffeinilytica]CAB3798539.1 Biotin carboxyl carrier protein of acetyl-CoA carboxylase [Paraburkholderia caffeinilytica]